MSMADMSAYERRAWMALIQDEVRHRHGVRARANQLVATGMSKASSVLQSIPGATMVTDQVDVVVQPILDTALSAVFLPAVRTASVERRTRALSKVHPDVPVENLFSVLDLRELDRGAFKLATPLIGAASSAAASLGVTGAEVSTTVSGGATAAAVVAAIAADVVATLGLLGRSVAEVAAQYGYDVREPEEEAFLMGVLSYSTAVSLDGKTAAMAALSRLTQRMMRRATWKELEGEVYVQIIRKIFNSLGLKLTHRRLAQAVPILGGAVSAAWSFAMLDTAKKDATRIYRARYLATKYGLDFDAWCRQESWRAADGAGASTDAQSDEDVVASMGELTTHIDAADPDVCRADDLDDEARHPS